MSFFFDFDDNSACSNKVDTSLGPVNFEFANITERDMNDNSKSIKVEGSSSDISLLSETMRDAIAKMRIKMLSRQHLGPSHYPRVRHQRLQGAAGRGEARVHQQTEPGVQHPPWQPLGREREEWSK